MKKVPVHVTISPAVAVALKALADLEGRSVSDLYEEIGRTVLGECGYLPKPDRKAIAARVKQILEERTDAAKHKAEP